MSKGYIHCYTNADGDPDISLADAAAVEVYVAANPTQFKVGSFVVAVDGTVCIVSAAGVTGLITVTEPTP